MEPIGKKCIVLVVEDDTDIREIIGQVLEFEGYPVRAPSDGTDALKQISEGEVLD